MSRTELDAPELPGGIRRFTMPMPPPLAHVHVWLIETGGGWAMFDTGFPTLEGEALLEQEIRPLLTAGRRLEAVFISHYHPDHTAFAGRLQRAFGCDVYVHRADWQRMQMMSRMDPSAARSRFSSGWAAQLNDGADAAEEQPDSMFARMRAARENMNLPLPEPSLVEGGETVTIGGREFEMIWTPGHTEGHLCMLDRGERALFTGDHLLARITPHIGMWPEDARSPLPQFEQSLGLVAELNPALALPAHERVIDRPAERAGEILEHHQERRQHILDAVDGGDRGIRDIAVAVFPKRAGDRMQLAMAMAETVAHLEALVEEDKLRRDGENASRSYAPA